MSLIKSVEVLVNPSSGEPRVAGRKWLILINCKDCVDFSKSLAAPVLFGVDVKIQISQKKSNGSV